MSTYKTRAIILNKKPWRENDALYSLYSEDFGKIRAVARGAKKINSKLAPHLEPLMITDLMLAGSKGIDKIAGSNLARDFCLLKASFPKLVLASQAVELVDKMVEEEHGDKRIFNLLERFFIFLNDYNGSEESLFRARTGLKVFTLQLLDFLGYTPELYNCVHCRFELAEKGGFFHSERGGIVCKNCSQLFSDRQEISLGTLKFLRLMLISDLLEINKINFDEILTREVERILGSFLRYQLEKELRSDRYLTNWREYVKLG